MPSYNLLNYVKKDKLISNAIQDNNISIEKFRQIIMVSGASPKSFFTIKNRKATAIENKNTLFNVVKNQSPMLNIFHLFPATIQNFVENESKNKGGGVVACGWCIILVANS